MVRDDTGSIYFIDVPGSIEEPKWFIYDGGTWKEGVDEEIGININKE